MSLCIAAFSSLNLAKFYPWMDPRQSSRLASLLSKADRYYIHQWWKQSQAKCNLSVCSAKLRTCGTFYAMPWVPTKFARCAEKCPVILDTGFRIVLISATAYYTPPSQNGTRAECCMRISLKTGLTQIVNVINTVASFRRRSTGGQNGFSTRITIAVAPIPARLAMHPRSFHIAGKKPWS